MKNEFRLAVDLGSSSARVMIAQREGGNLSYTEIARFAHTSCERDGALVWDIEKLFENIIATIDEAIAKYNIVSIGICSWGVDYALVQAGGKLFDKAKCYRDERNQKAYEKLHATMTQEMLFNESGIFPNPINTMYQLLADINEGRYEKCSEESKQVENNGKNICFEASNRAANNVKNICREENTKAANNVNNICNQLSMKAANNEKNINGDASKQAANNEKNDSYGLSASEAACSGGNAPLKLLMIADYLAFKLTGVMRVEKSNASTTGLLSKTGNEWNFPLIEKLGIDKQLFPELISSGDTYGQYKGIAVKAVCTHDTASAIVAMQQLKQDSVFISSGSWILIGTLCASPVVSKKAFEREYTNERGAGGVVTLLNNMNGLFVIQRLVAELGVSYKQIDKEVEGARSLGIVDTNLLTSPDNMSKNILMQLVASGSDDNVLSASPMDLIKTVYDSLAQNIANAIKQLEEVTDRKFLNIYLSGGMSKAPYLLKEFKKKCPLPLEIIDSEGAIVGNIIMQEKGEK